jgi:hypothetical protein
VPRACWALARTAWQLRIEAIHRSIMNDNGPALFREHRAKPGVAEIGARHPGERKVRLVQV